MTKLGEVFQQSLRDGVYYFAFTGSLLLAAHLVPLLHFFAGLGLLALAGFLTRERTSAYALFILLASGMFLSLSLQTLNPALTVTEFGLLGVLYGLGFKNGLKPQRLLWGGVLAGQILHGLTLLVLFLALGHNPFDAQQFLAGVEELTPLEEQVLQTMAVVLPGSYVVSAWFMAVAGFFTLQHVLAGRGTVDNPLPFAEWRLPWTAVWMVIAGLGMYLAGDQWSIAGLKVTGANILVISVFVFATLGLSTVAALKLFARLSRFWRVVLLAAAVFYLPVIFTALAVLGFLDAGFNFREWFRRKED
ncbi:DUF2232 domain-containing protein [Desulforudis sp. 1088]